MDKKLTIKEHVELGSSLRKVSDKLVLSKNKLDIKAKKLADQLRSILDDVLLRDYGKEGDKKFPKNWWQDIYYGNAGRRKDG